MREPLTGLALTPFRQGKLLADLYPCFVVREDILIGLIFTPKAIEDLTENPFAEPCRSQLRGGVLRGSRHSFSRFLTSRRVTSLVFAQRQRRTRLVEPCCSYLASTLEGEAS